MGGLALSHGDVDGGSSGSSGEQEDAALFVTLVEDV